jgi:hypothetical protein
VNQRDVVTYNLAELLQRQGKFRQAKDILEPLLGHVRGEGSKSVLGATLESLGSIAEIQGDMSYMYRRCGWLPFRSHYKCFLEDGSAYRGNCRYKGPDVSPFRPFDCP